MSAQSVHPSGQIRSVQALRALAALFVVVFHSTVLLHDKFAPHFVPWQNGNAGVDLFFVISGFIMVISSRRLRAQADGWRRFLEFRLIRVVPMYWLVTLLKLAAVALVPALALHTRPTLWNGCAAFLFFPARDAAGMIRPPLDVGWTLSYEMLFYMVFAGALYLRVAPLRILVPVMLSLSLLSLALPANGPAFFTLASPLVLEFVFGAALGQAFINGSLSRAAASPWTLAIAAVGVAGLAFLPLGGIWLRVAFWGSAATAALGGAILAERWLDPFLPRWLERLGEASYALYLTHGFVLPIAAILVAHTGLTGGTRCGVLIVVCVVLSVITAMVTYRCIEAPLTVALRRIAADRRPASSLAAPQSAI